jgi:hypothetical protein
MRSAGDWPVARRIDTRRLMLEPLRVSHADEMVFVPEDEALYEYTGGRPATLEELRALHQAGSRATAGEGNQDMLCAYTRRPRAYASAASEESPDGGHHLFGPLVLLSGFCADHAGVCVPVEQSERDLVQRGLGGADLGEDVDAVAVVLDHSLDPSDLTFDPRQPREQLVLGGGIAPGGRLPLRHAPQSTTTTTATP